MINSAQAVSELSALNFDALLSAGNLQNALESLHLLSQSRIRSERSKGVGGRIADLDAACQKFANVLSTTAPKERTLIGFDRPTNVYIVSEIYQTGGHRGILEQLVRARSSERNIVLFTCAFGNNRQFGTERVSALNAFPIAPDVSLSLYEKLQWLRGKLAAFCATRVFLLHHPEDALAAIASYEIENHYQKRLYFIRHADTVPSLGSFLSQATHVAIRKEQRDEIRTTLPNASVALIPLSFDPDCLQPGLEPNLLRYIEDIGRGFFNSSHFVTATCGGAHKFSSVGPLGLPNIISGILKNPFRRHIHVGPLTSELRNAILQSLEKAQIPSSRLKLTGEVRSVAETLAAERVDLFIASTPIGGGLTISEAAYVGIPIAIHESGGAPLDQYLSGFTHAPDKVLAWKTPAELFDALDRFDERNLLELSLASREWYRGKLSARRFHLRLAALIAATEGRMRNGSLASVAEREVALFDAGFYVDLYEDVRDAGIDPQTHFTQYGAAEGRQPNILFLPQYYLAQLPPTERKNARKNPLGHYLLRGERKGYAPHPLFSPELCARSFRQIGREHDCSLSLLEQFLRCKEAVRPHMFFDPVFYEQQLPLPVLAGEPHLVHFLREGAQAGISPHPLVDLERMNGLHGFLSYLTGEASAPQSPHLLFDPAYFSRKEGRRNYCAAPNLLWEHLIEGNAADHEPHPLISPKYVEQRRPGILQSAITILELLAVNKLKVDTHPLVNGAYICQQAPWVKTSPISATEYFIRHGASQNINPNSWFLTNYYLNSNADVALAGVNPLSHYISNGDFESRAPHPFFDPAFYRRTWMGPSDQNVALVSYFERGTGHFFNVQMCDAVFQHLSLKLSKRSFEAGEHSAAKDYLREGLHSEWAAQHPTLITETRALAIDTTLLETNADDITAFDEEIVAVNRPSIVSANAISAPAGSYLAPKGETATFSNVTVVGGNDGFITDGYWYDPGLIGFDPETMVPKHSTSVFSAVGAKVLLRRYSAHDFFEAGILACGSYSHNYFHFLFEVLPRAILAADKAPFGTPLLVDAEMPNQHYQALKLFLPKNPIIQLARNQSYEVATLYAASMPSLVHDAFGKSTPPTDSVRYHPAILKRLAQFADPLRDNASPRRLFLRRDGSIRRLLNIDDIQRELVAQGFEVVSCDRLDFSAQVKLFANADIIIGPTGAHLANMVFAPPGCRIFPLYSDAPGTNYYLWSAMADVLGQRLVNLVGPRVVGSVAGRAPEAHEDYSVPTQMVTAFIQNDGKTASDDVSAVHPPVNAKSVCMLLDRISAANTDAAVLTASWSVLAENEVSTDFSTRICSLREQFLQSLDHLAREELSSVFQHAIYSNIATNLRSGLILQTSATAQSKDYPRRFAEWSRRRAKTEVDQINRLNDLLRAVMCYQPWQLDLLCDLSDLPAGLPEDRYLAWITSQPFLVTEADEESYTRFVLRLLDWFDSHLSCERPLKQLSKIVDALQKLDLGKLLLIEKPIGAIQAARTRILEKLALSTEPCRKTIRPLDGSEGRRRVGILFRTFAKGPDSEAVVAFLRDFDKSRWEIIGYSMGYSDKVARADREFDLELAKTFDGLRVLENDASTIRETLLRDDLDVFLFANATAYGVTEFDIALYRRIAPLQVVLNSHLPMPLGYPSFDSFLTGLSDKPSREVNEQEYSEEIVRVRGPVINYLTSLEPRPDVNLTRARLNLEEADVVLLCAGSLSKLGWNFLATAMTAANGIPHSKLVLAPYNPGWAGVSLAIPFMHQVKLCASETGFDINRLRILGELSVSEAEAAVELADLYLAPFPHGGATMLHLALVRGVPPIVLRRTSTRSIDQFLVDSFGFSDLLADSPQDYVQLVQRLANDTNARRMVSSRIRGADKSSLVKSKSYSLQMEATLVHLLERQNTNLSDGKTSGEEIDYFAE